MLHTPLFSPLCFVLRAYFACADERATMRARLDAPIPYAAAAPLD